MEVQEEASVEEISVQINCSGEENEQERSMIEEIVQLMQSEQTYNTNGLKQVNRNILSEWVGKANKTIGRIGTGGYDGPKYANTEKTRMDRGFMAKQCL